jgi:hypothetical protein
MPDTYAEHIAQCNQLAQSSPDNLRRACTFVLATIQQQLETVPAIMRDFERNGSKSKYAFGSKSAGLDFLRDNIYALDSAAHQALARKDWQMLLEAFLAVPGLGMVKSGFACQLFAGSVGCIDTHNIKLYGVKLSTLKYGYPKRRETIERKLSDYIGLCHGIGSRDLWAGWCQYVANLRPDNWADGEAVSQLHIDCLSGHYGGSH